MDDEILFWDAGPANRSEADEASYTKSKGKAERAGNSHDGRARSSLKALGPALAGQGSVRSDWVRVAVARSTPICVRAFPCLENVKASHTQRDTQG